jgi:hypothetical protein
MPTMAERTDAAHHGWDSTTRAVAIFTSEQRTLADRPGRRTGSCSSWLTPQSASYSFQPSRSTRHPPPAGHGKPLVSGFVPAQEPESGDEITDPGSGTAGR